MKTIHRLVWTMALSLWTFAHAGTIIQTGHVISTDTVYPGEGRIDVHLGFHWKFESFDPSLGLLKSVGIFGIGSASVTMMDYYSPFEWGDIIFLSPSIQPDLAPNDFVFLGSPIADPSFSMGLVGPEPHDDTPVSLPPWGYNRHTHAYKFVFHYTVSDPEILLSMSTGTDPYRYATWYTTAPVGEYGGDGYMDATLAVAYTYTVPDQTSTATLLILALAAVTAAPLLRSTRRNRYGNSGLSPMVITGRV